MSVITEEQTAITLSDEAAVQVRQLLEKQGRTDLALRLFVTQGGCSGFSYGMALDPNTRNDDYVFEKDGVRLIVVVRERTQDVPAGPERRVEHAAGGRHNTVFQPLDVRAEGRPRPPLPLADRLQAGGEGAEPEGNLHG